MPNHITVVHLVDDHYLLFVLYVIEQYLSTL